MFLFIVQKKENHYLVLQRYVQRRENPCQGIAVVITISLSTILVFTTTLDRHIGMLEPALHWASMSEDLLASHFLGNHFPNSQQSKIKMMHFLCKSKQHENICYQEKKQKDKFTKGVTFCTTHRFTWKKDLELHK